MSNNYDELFSLIDKAGGVKLKNLKALTFRERRKVSINLPAAILGPIYYLYIKCWKKAITYTLISLVLIAAIYILISMLFGDEAADGAPLQVISSVIFATRANIDLYKKHRLESNGWI